MTRPAAFLMAVALLAGCSAEPARTEVSGAVTFDGKPLRRGRIYFDPDPAKGNTGVQGYAEVADGRYDTAKGGKGGVSGPVIVRIDGQGDPGSGYPEGVPLFNSYEFRVELPAAGAAAHDFNVPASARLKGPLGPPP